MHKMHLLICNNIKHGNIRSQLFLVRIILMFAIVSVIFLGGPIASQEIKIGERPAVESHVDQAMIDSGQLGLEDLMRQGDLLFSARFNSMDGQGRPASTGTGDPRDPDEPAFIRTSSPDSNSCSGCHNQPRPGGAGGFVANVFVLAQAQDPVIESVSAAFSNERNTLGMHGAGPIEMLSREMSADLITIRDSARLEASESNKPATRELITKGVYFGIIKVMPDGKIDPTGLEGIDWDLIIKPFHQKGAVVSIREFTNNAMNHHHGMQSMERFGEDIDADMDGVFNELTVGDITAVTIFQASLGTPGQILPNEQVRKEAIELGEQRFNTVGCISCHLPFLELDSPVFTEPNPFNPPGNLHPNDTSTLFSFDMTKEGSSVRLESNGDGGAIVRAFTDLKRHNLNDQDYNHFANEQLPQGTLNGFSPASDFTIEPEPRLTTDFLTRKLWDVGNTDPYGHRGDLTTMTLAIHFHGGEARETRDAFFALPQEEQDAIIEYLKTLQIVPSANIPQNDVTGDGIINAEDLFLFMRDWHRKTP